MKRPDILILFTAILLTACLAGGTVNLMQTASPTETAGGPAVMPAATLEISPPLINTATATMPSAVTATPLPTIEQWIPPVPVISPLVPGQEPLLYFIQMINAVEGWAVSGPGPDDHILFTRDGGISWQEVTPPEAASSDAPGKQAQPFFLDTLHAWVAYFPVDYPVFPPLTIWFTTDSGKTWQASTLPVGPEIEGGSAFDLIFFADNQNGWIGLSHGAAAGSSPFSLYHTADGGRTWKQILTPFSSESGSLDACCRNGITFLNPLTGLITSASGAYPNAYVNWTLDGGFTWQNQDLTNYPPEDLDAPFCTSSSPQTLSPQSVAVVVDCTRVNPEQTFQRSARLYLTSDFGMSWSSYNLPSPDNEASNWAGWQRSWKILFHGSLFGYTFVEDIYQSADGTLEKDITTIYQSQDGGKTWNWRGKTTWRGQFSFVNDKLGWAVARAGEEIALVRTTNGGQSWALIKPATQK